jgi:hypothetical protein
MHFQDLPASATKKFRSGHVISLVGHKPHLLQMNQIAYRESKEESNTLPNYVQTGTLHPEKQRSRGSIHYRR